MSRSEWRKQKRAREKARLEAKRVETARQMEPESLKKRAGLIAANKARLETANSISTKLWAWGVNSEKHPTRALGVFPTIIMYLIFVPLLGFLYHLSFTVLGPVMILGAALIAFLFQRNRKKLTLGTDRK
jgi:hypothetical protein